MNQNPARVAPDWRVEVEDFGRVDHADITMAPLVVLVGRNNSGKSYLASLLWGLLNIEETFLARRSRPAPPSWFAEYLHRDDIDEPVDKLRLQAWLNDVMAARKDDVARQLLSHNGISIGALRITLGSAVDCYFEREEPIDDDDSFMFAQGRSARNYRDVEINYEIGPTYEGIPDAAQTSLLVEAIEAVMFGIQHLSLSSAPIYLPAARTGLMLSLPLIFNELLGKLGLAGDIGGTRFPLPTINFLQRIVNAKGEAGKASNDIADFLERSLLRGSLRRDEGTSPSFSYQPANGVAMPLHTASSMVSELAPFLILLRSASLERGLVFEEPESHLHLGAQRELARAIARLVNLGVPVVVTTHSDTFIQQLNILISLYGHPDRERLMARYEYGEADLIDPRHVRGYEFMDTDHGRSRVEPVAMVETGLVVQSLNDVLIELSEEAIATQDR